MCMAERHSFPADSRRERVGRRAARNIPDVLQKDASWVLSRFLRREDASSHVPRSHKSDRIFPVPVSDGTVHRPEARSGAAMHTFHG